MFVTALGARCARPLLAYSACSTAPKLRARRQHRPIRTCRAQAEAGKDDNGVPPGSQLDLPATLTVCAFACHTLLGKYTNLSFSLTPGLIYSALAWTTLASGVLSLLPSLEAPPDSVGAAVGPVFLAVNALHGFPYLGLTPWQTAAALFGVVLIRRLPQFRSSTLVWLATLAAAVWNGLGSEWLVAAFGLSSAWRMVCRFRQNSVALQEICFVAFSVAVAGQQLYQPAALAICAGHIVASVVS